VPRVIRSPEALADAEAIWNHVAQDRIGAADQLLDRIALRCDLLAGHPEIGQARPELGPDLRSFTVGNYVLFYRPSAQGIELVRIIHAARDVDALF